MLRRASLRSDASTGNAAHWQREANLPAVTLLTATACLYPIFRGGVAKHPHFIFFK
jgi:hypothetical protein